MSKRMSSIIDKDVFIEPWECPLTCKDPLFFVGMLEVFDIRFFIVDHKSVYVVTIPRRSVYRVVDETCLGQLGKLITTGVKHPRYKTYKIWGTPFLKELDDQGLLFLHRPNKEDHFQYIIFTEDESPEFVSPEPIIDVYPDGEPSVIMKKLFEEDLKTREQVGFAGSKWDPSSKSK